MDQIATQQHVQRTQILPQCRHKEMDNRSTRACSAPGRHVDDRGRAARVEGRREEGLVLHKVIDAQGGAHNDKLQGVHAVLRGAIARGLAECAALRQDAREHSNEEVCVERPLMRLIQQDHRVPAGSAGVSAF